MKRNIGDGHRFGCNISYVVQELTENQNKSTSPGLANALDSAYHLIKDKTVFFGMADTIMQPNNVFQDAYQASLASDDVILILFSTEHPEKFGMVRTDNKDQVVEIIDKPSTTDLKNMWGGIIWRPRFTDHLHECVSQKGISDFAYIMNNAIQKGFQFRGFTVVEGVYIDLGTYEEIMEFDRNFRDE
jgi:glucose-1-phosphate thymidylyltransferase